MCKGPSLLAYTNHTAEAFYHRQAPTHVVQRSLPLIGMLGWFRPCAEENVPCCSAR